MQFVVNKQNLQKELGFVQGIVERKNTIPVLSNILIESVGETNIRITGTDLDVTIRCDMDAEEISAPGAMCVQARKLFEIARLLPDGPVSFKKEDNDWVTVTCDKTRFKMVGIKKDDFPEVPSFKSAPTKISAGVIKVFVDRTIFAITQEESRYTLSGAKFILDDTGAKMITTDGHRLAYVERKGVSKNGSDESIDTLIPRKTLAELTKLTAGYEGEISLGMDGNHIFFEVGPRLLISRMLYGQFPNYDMVMPKNNDKSIQFDGALLNAAIRRVALMSDERSHAIRFHLEPNQLVRRVAGATYEGTGAVMCAACVSLGEKSEAACVFDREGSAEDSALLRVDRLRSWLSSSTSSSAESFLMSDQRKFFLRDESHGVEYTAPLRFGGRTKGALIVAFDKREDCDDTVCRLVDAAAQQAALATHISSLYQAARDASANLTIEVERRTAEVQAQRRFIEAIIDSLPLSLYAIDRNYEIVAWNRNRELGELGIPRGSVLGKNIFKVLTRQKQELLQDEFTSVFATGDIHRIEHATANANGEMKHWLISKIPMWTDLKGGVSHVITIGEEITDRVEANRAVARAEKLAAIGRLAAGACTMQSQPVQLSLGRTCRITLK